MTFHVTGSEPGPWPGIFGAAGFFPEVAEAAGIHVVRSGEAVDGAALRKRIDRGAFVVLEGASSTALEFGFKPGKHTVRVASVLEERRPGLDIVWEHPLVLPVYEMPAEARVFTRERWTGAPLAAGFRCGAGAVFWVAVSPGERGYERFPFILHSLADLGLAPPVRSRRLWAFFDSSYRLRADLDYLARRWRAAGIAALHVAAWHYWEPDAGKDSYLGNLIETCHRNGIQVYAWLELPHVSEKFWDDHAGWREKTAVLQDAHLDWRKLMNLSNRECFRAVAAGVRRLIERFDWDGVNLAELYFESLEGHYNPARFTPMNDDVRSEFRRRGGFDPIELFTPSSDRHFEKNKTGLRTFLDFRAAQSRRIQTEWIAEIDAIRGNKPGLDLVITHVDDRFDARMRDALGADAAELLRLPGSRAVTFLVEDPATVWNLGPERYQKIADQYTTLIEPGRLAIDINIVTRYQDVYPTKQQTGTELFQLVHHATRAFSRVALYSENSISAEDAPWLAAAAAAPGRLQRAGERLKAVSPHGMGIPWQGAALVDGHLWPAADGEVVWLPPGEHTVEPATEFPAMRILDFNGTLRSATATAGGIEFTYESPARAFVQLDRQPAQITIDGAPASEVPVKLKTGVMLRLPRGQHIVEIDAE